MKKWNLKGVSKDTWVRTIALFLVLVNQVSVGFFDFQLIPFADEQIYEAVSVVLTIGITIWSAWKNNSFTTAAQEGDQLMNRLKKDDINEVRQYFNFSADGLDIGRTDSPLNINISNEQLKKDDE